ncbi:hypothetical protein PspLS_08945 [Pyricularia sp. CBS 133598]|nr:hypothetical protein PspLS_08945 [Pyricularia sp. CBS 133598]
MAADNDGKWAMANGSSMTDAVDFRGHARQQHQGREHGVLEDAVQASVDERFGLDFAEKHVQEAQGLAFDAGAAVVKQCKKHRGVEWPVTTHEFFLWEGRRKGLCQ